jgi:polyhydroxyalkanoate synthesis repressor PhaR
MPRLVKRYSNRKLYDTSDSRYVTLDEIARWIRAGEEVQIVENETGEDLTAVTFAQIILESERKKSNLLPIRMLRELIQHGESAWGELTEAVDRGVDVLRQVPERAAERVQELSQVGDRLGELQRRVDDALRKSMERVTGHPTFQQELRRIVRTMEALEARIGRLRQRADGDAGDLDSEVPPPLPAERDDEAPARKAGES